MKQKLKQTKIKNVRLKEPIWQSNRQNRKCKYKGQWNKNWNRQNWKCKYKGQWN